MRGIIYALAEPGGYNIRYCGKTVMLLRDRLHAHATNAYRYRHRHVCNWLRTIYDRNEKPESIVLQEVDLVGLTRKEQLDHLNRCEQSWIATLRTLGFRLTNATNGGDGCHGRKVSKETREKSARSNRGKKRTAEMCEKFRQIGLARPPSSFVRGKDHPHFGKPQTWSDPEARREKIRAFWRNNPEACKAQGRQLLGNKHAARLSDDLVNAVLNAEGSQSAVARRYGVSQAYVSMLRNGLRRKGP
jgi:hypothetical protein